MTRWLETDIFTNKDISAAVLVGSYTADADRFVAPQLLIDQAAGNGDYVYYVKLQVNGAGSSYVIGPKATHAAASGETAIGAQGGFVFVRSGDVLTVYVDGLAGDTSTPDTTVRWAELAALRPTTADRTIAVDASGLVDLVPAPNATAVAAMAAGVLAEMNAAPPDVNVATWLDGVPAALDGLRRVPVGTLHEIALDGISGSTVSASSASDVRDYLVGLVAFLEYTEAPP